MPTVLKFEDLEVWQLAREINEELFAIIKRLRDSKEFELAAQLDRSSGSVMDNVAEGFERDGNKEFTQFLAISKASLAEVKSQLYRVKNRLTITEEEFESLVAKCNLLSAKLAAFINYLRTSNYKGNKFK
ncbi:MAG TPA: four helix bundle protein [Bacteroidia bacterium]|nr:four helix bundle protein [Bacteroidia bacterium]